MKEVWKRLIYQGNDYGDFYEVSNLGDIRNAKTKRVRKKNVLKTGYYFVTGSLGSRDKKITFKIHKAVAETFINNPNNLPVPNHKDGNKLNNYVGNLEWCTHSENTQHAYKHNLAKAKQGENNPNARLDNESVQYIREHYIPYDKNFGTRGLARKFNVHHKTIENILNNIKWKQ